jgi:hypothetical protein
MDSHPQPLRRVTTANRAIDLHSPHDAREVLSDDHAIRQLQAVRDALEVVREHAKSAAGLKVRNRAARARLRLERKAGRLLARLHLQGGNRKSAQRPKPLALKDLGISHSQSARWQREASVPRETFQRYLRETASQGREITSSGLLQVADGSPDAIQLLQNGRDILQNVALALRRMEVSRAPFQWFSRMPQQRSIGLYLL